MSTRKCQNFDIFKECNKRFCLKGLEYFLQILFKSCLLSLNRCLRLLNSSNWWCLFKNTEIRTKVKMRLLQSIKMRQTNEWLRLNVPSWRPKSRRFLSIIIFTKYAESPFSPENVNNQCFFLTPAWFLHFLLVSWPFRNKENIFDTSIPQWVTL